MATNKAALNKIIGNAVIYLLLIIVGTAYFFPLFWMLSSSIMPDHQLFRFPPQVIPDQIMWSNFYNAMTLVPFFLYLRNTILIATGAMIGVVISCPLAAYSLARIQWKGRGVLMAITIGVMMIPAQVTIIPLFIIFTRVGLLGTLVPLILPTFFGVPFYIFLMRQFFRQLPRSLEDAARIDGGSEFQIYRYIMFPLCQPAVLTIALFQVIASWNDFTAPLIYLTTANLFTLQLGLQHFTRAYDSQWGLLMAAAALVALPVIAVFFLVQKSFIQGITFGGVKG